MFPRPPSNGVGNSVEPGFSANSIRVTQMTNQIEKSQDAEAIFERACQLKGEAQAKYLDDACGDENTRLPEGMTINPCP